MEPKKQEILDIKCFLMSNYITMKYKKNNIFIIREVRKIAILDIRILNCDRNDGNILVTK